MWSLPVAVQAGRTLLENTGHVALSLGSGSLTARPLVEHEVPRGVKRAGDGAEDDRVLPELALGDSRPQRGELGQAALERRAAGGGGSVAPAAKQDELGIEDRGDRSDDQGQAFAFGLDGGQGQLVTCARGGEDPLRR